MKDEEFVDFHTTIAKMKANLPLQIELAEVIMAEFPIRCKAMKRYFDDLVAVGFSKGEALEIVKTQGWMGR